MVEATAIVSSRNEYELLGSLFALLDKDEDGKIGIDDLQSFMHTTLAIHDFSAAHIDRNAAATEIDDGFLSIARNDENNIGSSAAENAVDFEGFLKLYESIMRAKKTTNSKAPPEGFRRRRIMNDGRSAADINRESEGDAFDHRLMDINEDCYAVDDEDLAAAFGVYDANGDGVISAVELASVLRRLGLLQQQMNGGDVHGQRITEEDVKYCQTLIDRFDTNGDGVIDLDEFSALLFSSSSI